MDQTPRHGRFRIPTVTNGYLDESFARERHFDVEAANALTGAITLGPAAWDGHHPAAHAHVVTRASPGMPAG